MPSFVTKKRKEFLQLIVRVIGSIVLMMWVLHLIDWGKIIEVSRKASFFYLVAAFLAIQITVIPSIWKWKLLIIKKSDRENVSLLKLGRFYYIGLFFNNFLPGSVGGDVVRVYYLGRITGMAAAAASVAFERFTSGIALVGIALFSSFALETSKTVTWSVLIISGIFLILFLILYLTIKSRHKGVSKQNEKDGRRKRKWYLSVRELLGKMADTFRAYRKKGLKWWGIVVVLSFLFQMGMAWINQLLFLSFGIHISWLELLMLITLISVITMLPVSVNGIGVREGSYVFFFHQLGIPSEVAVAVSLLFFFLVAASSLVGGLFWMSERGHHREAVRKQTN